MILRRRPDHGGAPDIDLLDALGRARPAGNRLLERVEIGDQQLERLDAELSELVAMGFVSQVGEQARRALAGAGS